MSNAILKKDARGPHSVHVSQLLLGKQGVAARLCPPEVKK